MLFVLQLETFQGAYNNADPKDRPKYGVLNKSESTYLNFHRIIFGIIPSLPPVSQ